MTFDSGKVEIEEMRKAVAKLARKRFPEFQSNEHYNTVPRGLFSELAEIGVTALSVPSNYGGIEANSQTCAAIMEELAAEDLGPAIFCSVHSMVCGIISLTGSEELKQRFLPNLASGKLLGAFALTEPSAGSDARNLKTQAQLIGDNFVINGSKCYITSAGWADIYIVFARTAPGQDRAGISCFLVEANTPGMTISSPEKKMGCELSPIASLTFENMPVPRAHLLGELHRGYSVALSGLARGRVNVAACANGLSRTAIGKAREHLKEREQFGSKLIEFQGLQFMLADMYLKHEAAKALTEAAALDIDTAAPLSKVKLSSSIAKCFATDAAMEITTDAVQLLGGAGYIKDYGVEKLMRDAKMLQIVEGTNQIQRLLIARELAK